MECWTPKMLAHGLAAAPARCLCGAFFLAFFLLLAVFGGLAHAAGAVGWTLAADRVVAGDLEWPGGTLDLNGKTLTVQGNLIQAAGEVRINGGTLNIEGAYRLQRACTTHASGYCASSGTLVMSQPADKVFVAGNLFIETLSRGSDLSAGLLQVKGHFAQQALDTGDSRQNFAAGGTHRTILAGSDEQKVFFTSPGATAAHFAHLELRNTSAGGVDFLSPVVASASFTPNSSKFVLSNPAQSALPGFSTATSGPVLSITGPLSLPAGGSAVLSAAITSTGGTATTVTPSWQVSPSSAASISASGQLTANTVTSETRIAVTATYRWNGSTLTATRLMTVTVGAVADNTLVSLNLIGPTAMQGGGRLNLMATAFYRDGATRAVTPLWTSSDPTAAVVSAAGVIFAGFVGTEKLVTVTARYRENAIDVAATLVVKIQPSRATLVGLEIAGPENLQTGGRAQLTVSALYSDDSRRLVTPLSWRVSDAVLGRIDSRGFLSLGQVGGDKPFVVTATYSESGVTVSADFTINLKSVLAALSRLTIVGARGTLAAGETLQLAAESRHADGSRRSVTANWSVSSRENPNAASISATGLLTANAVTRDTPLLIVATYTEGGISARAEFHALIRTAAATAPLLAEVEATGESDSYSVSLWFNTDTEASTARTVRGTTYRLYVAALIPAGQLVGSPTYFVLNRANAWEPLSWPLADYLSGVEENTWELIELIDSIDATMISGTQIFVGYGVDDTEMMAAGRYSLVYQIP